MNLIEWLELRGVAYKVHGEREGEISVCCPFCEEQGTTPDTRFRLGINVVLGKMNCFNCGKKSNNKEYTFQELQRVWETGRLELAAKVIRQKEQVVKKIKLPDDFQPIEKRETKDRWHNVAFRYLRARGLTSAQITDKGIGYSLVGELRYRIVIPVLEQGTLVGLVARAFVQDLEPKYKNSLGRKSLYNLPDQKMDDAILVEGAFDALACERSVGDRYDCLGVLGHALTDRQVEQLKPYKRTLLWPDPDDAGVNGFLRMAKRLEGEGKYVGMILPELDGSLEYDPSDLDNREIKTKIKGMVRYGGEVEDMMRTKLAFLEE